MARPIILPDDELNHTLRCLELRHAELLRYFNNLHINLIDRPSSLDDAALEKSAGKVPVEIGGVFVVLGIGDGRYLKALVKRLIPGCFVIVYEHNPVWFQTLCLTTNLAEVFKCPFVKILVEHPGEVQGWVERALLRSIGQVMCVQCPEAFQYEQKAYQELMEGPLAFVAVQQQVRFTTLDTFGEKFISNYLANLPVYATSPGAEVLRGQGKGRTAVIVGSGPSMNKACDHWLCFHDDLIIIAADSSARGLQKHGIEPNIVVSVDPQNETANKFTGLKFKDDTILVFHPHGCPQVVKGWEGAYISTNAGTPLNEWLGECWPAKGTLEGLVHCQVHMCFNVAVELEVDRIILVGCDMCYKDGIMHAAGTSYHNDIREAGLSVDELQIENIDGETVQTTRLFQSYRQMWVEKIHNCQIPVFNASEGGLSIQHAEFLHIKEVRKMIQPTNQGRWRLEVDAPKIDSLLLFEKIKRLETDLKTCLALAKRLYEILRATKFTRDVKLTARAERLGVRIQRYGYILDFISVCASRANRLLLCDKSIYVDHDPNLHHRFRQQRVKANAFAQSIVKHAKQLIPLTITAYARLTDPNDPCYRRTRKDT